MLPGPYSFSVAVALLADVEDLGRLGLHPVGDLHRLDRRFELRIADRFALDAACRFERLEQVELAALLGQRELVVVDVRDQLLRIEVLPDRSRLSVCFSTLSEMYVPWWTAGRNALFHSGGPTVVGTSGQSTT